MKQKRKVKSLLSLKKNKKELFLMNLLLILSVSLCIGSALLITTSVGATADDTNICPNDICSYTGLDDKSEVLYRMDFVDPENLEKTVNSMYIKNSNFYITSGQVIVNPATADETDIDRNVNKVGTGVYSHILGGSGNEVYSDNITIIAGENNKISSGNDNATILGGKNNNLSGGTPQGTPIISLGGENNKAEKDHDGVALIGGEGNEIGEAVSNTFILGGKNNKVSDTENVIVGGSDVTISGTKNIFVYSNSGNFEPKTDNAFYLNVIGGVGINGTGSVGGMAAENAVSIGDIDINNSCNEDNLGVVGSYQGCLVGCTQKGKDDGHKWELLDRGSGCAETCSNSAKCIAGNNITGTIVPANNYNAQCTEGYVDTENAHLCPSVSGYISQYRNVIFETNLLDSDDPCPYEQENLCVYKCNQGFHLTGDVVSGTIKCYKDCEYDWVDAGKQILKHNQTVIGYNSGEVACARQTPDKSTQGQNYPETCHNNNHKKTLVCSNGVVYIAKSDNKTPSTEKAFEKGYKYSLCQTKDFQCDSSYNLTKDQITNSFGNGGLSDTVNQWTKNDRYKPINDRYKPINGIRGQYQLCLDYKGNTNGTCETQQTQDPYESHYKLVKCQNGYDLMDGKCMKRCYLQGNKCDVNKDGVFNISDNTRYVNNCKNDPSSPIECDLNGDGKYDNADSVLFQSCSASVALSGVYAHGTVTTGYKAASATCTGTCQAIGLRCNDGDWVSTTNGNKVTDYPYNNCTLHPKTCGDQYNVSHADYLQWSWNSIYESCDSYNPNGKFDCVKSDTRYKLIGCKTGYHATSDKKYCIPNREKLECLPTKPDHSNWVRQGGYVTDYPGFSIFSGIDVNAGRYLRWWNGVWDATNGWGAEKYPENACDWTCIGGYHKSGDSCVSNSCIGGDKPEGNNVLIGNNHPSGNGNRNRVYTGVTNPGTCEWTCKTGYTRAQDASGNRLNYCVEKQCGDGLPISMNGVLTGKSTYTGADDNRDWTYNSGTLGACQWKCRNGREKSGNGCILTVNASCGRNPQHFKCGEGTPTNQQTGRDGNTIKGWTWNCMGTPGGNSQELCIECNIEQGYSRQNNTCVKEPVECGGIRPTGDGVVEGNSYIYYTTHGVQGYTGWTYINSPQAVGSACCSWSCESGYVVNSDKTGCTIEEKCGTIKRGIADWAGGHYAGGRVTSGACIGGNFVGDPFLDRGVIISRSNPNGCGDLYVKRKCSNGGSTRDCSRRANFGTLDVIYGNAGAGYGSLGSLTVTQSPYECDNSACMSARIVKVRFTFKDNTSCELGVSANDKKSITYHVIPNYLGYTAAPDYNIACKDSNGVISSKNSYDVKKVEIAGEKVYCGISTCTDVYDIDTVIPTAYLNGNEDCLGETVLIYGS